MSMISMIIPCYNEQEALPLLYPELVKLADKMKEKEFEFLFINDGSKDRTLEVIRSLAQQDERVRYCSFSRNFGKEAAMYAGFCKASGDWVAVIDADMQDPPALVEEMMGYLESGEYDSVATRRVTREGEPPVRSFFARMFYKIINRISDVDIVDGARDFRLMSRQMADVLVSMKEYNRFSKGLYGWIGFKTKWLEFVNVPRVAGETKWSFWGLLKYSIDGIVSFSTMPLILSSLVGLVMCVVAFLAVVFLVGRKLIFGDPVAGWASLACIVVFIGGIQLFCLGILGQYLAKAYLEMKKRPIFIISETNIETEKDEKNGI